LLMPQNPFKNLPTPKQKCPQCQKWKREKIAKQCKQCQKDNK
jgi:hypothetical protein